MRKVLLTSAAACAIAAAFAAAPAQAADLPERVAPAPVAYTPAPIFTWTGFYIGLNAGGAWQADSDDDHDWWNGVGVAGFGPGLGVLPVTFATTTAGTGFWGWGDEEDGDTSFTGGLTVGYNMQFNQFVLGVEGDINYLDTRRHNFTGGAASFTVLVPTVFGPAGTTYTWFGENDDSSGNWFGTARLRAGVAFDRFMVYATGGLAYRNGADDHGWGTIVRTTPGGATSLVAFPGINGDDDDSIGWTAGAGVEAAVTDNISVKVEYLYAHFGDRTAFDPITTLATGFNTFSETSDDVHIVRAGINFKFSTFGF